MRIGITTGSSVNPVAAALVHLLDAQSDRPACVLMAGQPRFNMARRYARRLGLIPAMQMMWEQFRGARSAGRSETYERLRALLQARGLEDGVAPLPDLCKRLGVPIVKVGSINAAESVETVRSMGLDVLVNVGGGIFRDAIIQAARVGILNAHMGYLPTFRGMNVLEWGVFYGDKVGVTVHFIDGGIDTGDILSFGEVSAGPGDSIATLRARATAKGVEMLAAVIASLKMGDADRSEQRPGDGKQYFVMHPRLLAVAGTRLARRSEEGSET